MFLLCKRSHSSRSNFKSFLDFPEVFIELSTVTGLKFCCFSHPVVGLIILVNQTWVVVFNVFIDHFKSVVIFCN